MQRSTKKFGLQPRFVIFKITLRISLYIPLLRGNSQNQPSTERGNKKTMKKTMAKAARVAVSFKAIVEMLT